MSRLWCLIAELTIIIDCETLHTSHPHDIWFCPKKLHTSHYHNILFCREPLNIQHNHNIRFCCCMSRHGHIWSSPPSHCPLYYYPTSQLSHFTALPLHFPALPLHCPSTSLPFHFTALPLHYTSLSLHFQLHRSDLPPQSPASTFIPLPQTYLWVLKCFDLKAKFACDCASSHASSLTHSWWQTNIHPEMNWFQG